MTPATVVDSLRMRSSSSSPAIEVREAAARDIPALRALFLRARRATFSWRPGEAFQLADFDAQTQGELLLVADAGDRPAGFIAVWQPDDFIHHLYVDAQYLRRGIGQALLRALPGWPEKRYRLKCLRRNTAALAFYRACGFGEIGNGAADDGEYLLLESADDGSRRRRP